MLEGRFPPPWFIEDVGGSFVVKASKPAADIHPLQGRYRAPIPHEAIDPQCRATDRSGHCQAARAIAQGLICLTKFKVPSSRSLSVHSWLMGCSKTTGA
jgi:hypothetical protein